MSLMPLTFVLLRCSQRTQMARFILESQHLDEVASLHHGSGER